MELSPQKVRTASFKTVKRGYDPDEVDLFKEQVAGAIESAQNQATAMEARARAAVGKLQEVTQQASAAREAAPAPAAPAPVAAPAELGPDAEIISRTLLLAQRTADSTVAEAKTEADAISSAARGEATSILEGARAMASKLLDEARSEARRSAEDERVKAENEVQALLARRDFLLSDADQLDQYLAAQRERLRDAAVSLHDLVDRVPGGLGEMRRPLLSASADPITAAPIEATRSEVAALVESFVDAPPAEPADAGTAADAGADLDATMAMEPPLAASDDDDIWKVLDTESSDATPAAGEPSLDFGGTPLDTGLRIGGDELQ